MSAWSVGAEVGLDVLRCSTAMWFLRDLCWALGVKREIDKMRKYWRLSRWMWVWVWVWDAMHWISPAGDVLNCRDWDASFANRSNSQWWYSVRGVVDRRDFCYAAYWLWWCFWAEDDRVGEGSSWWVVGIWLWRKAIAAKVWKCIDGGVIADMAWHCQNLIYLGLSFAAFIFESKRSDWDRFVAVTKAH